MKEMMRANDRALANIESIPEGFNELRKLHHILDTSFGLNEERKKEKIDRLQGKWPSRGGEAKSDEWTKMFSKLNEVLGEPNGDISKMSMSVREKKETNKRMCFSTVYYGV
jgi:hypothetical protein